MSDKAGLFPSLHMNAQPVSPLRSAASAFVAHALAADLFALSLAAAIVAVASPTPSPTGHVPTEPWMWSLTLSVTVLLVACARRDYRVPMRPDLVEVLRQVVTTTAVAAVIVMTARVMLTNDTYVAAGMVRHLAVLVPLLIVLRAMVLWFEARARRSGLRVHQTLIVGAGHVGQRVASRLANEPELGLRPVAFLDRVTGPPDGPEAPHPVYDADGDIAAIVRQHNITYAFLAFAYGGDTTMPDIAQKLWEAGVTVAVVPRLFELGGERIALAHLGGMPVAVIRPPDPDGWRITLKYGFDRVAAGVALLVLAPVLLTVAMAVRISLGAPILYRQRRKGNDGYCFEMLKFRTLLPAPEGGAEADADWANAQLGAEAPDGHTGHDARLTPVGRLLRRYSLDELPQLWNVLRGDMSLIGPRPERVEYADRFEESIHRYRDRHRVRSGLTGWAQVSGLRGKTSLTDRVEWDNHYIENWSPWLDLKILLLTVPRALRHRQA